jgi:glutaredoxin 3
MMANIVMYTAGYCPYCVNAERLLTSKGVTDINKIRIDEAPELRNEMMEKTGRRTVPQIYINEQHIGGFDDLRALDLAGELEPLLAKEA